MIVALLLRTRQFRRNKSRSVAVGYELFRSTSNSKTYRWLGCAFSGSRYRSRQCSICNALTCSYSYEI